MKDYRTRQTTDHGFSLVEMIIAVAVIMILAAITAPTVVNTVADINLRYSAVNISGILQSARITAVQKNSFFSIQPVAQGSGQTGYFVDLSAGKTGTYSIGYPMITLGSNITVHTGTGSGAPNESGFISTLNFVGLYSGTTPGSFNARGLPCAPTPPTCAANSGQGFVYFLSRPGFAGNISWAAVVITPSGRVQVWTCDSAGNWIQR